MIHLAALETTRRVRIGERRAVRAANATVSSSNSTSGECEVHVHASREPHAAPWRTERRGENGERRLRYRQGEREREGERKTERTNVGKGERSCDSLEEERPSSFFFRGEELFGSFWSTTSCERKVPPPMANFFTPSAPDISPHLSPSHFPTVQIGTNEWRVSARHERARDLFHVNQKFRLNPLFRFL